MISKNVTPYIYFAFNLFNETEWIYIWKLMKFKENDKLLLLHLKKSIYISRTFFEWLFNNLILWFAYKEYA